MENVVVMQKPYTMEQMKEALRGENEGYIEGVVAVDLSDVIDNDLEGFLDLISYKMTGTELLMDINYNVVGHEEDMLFIKVRGDVSNIVDCEDDDSYDDEEDY